MCVALMAQISVADIHGMDEGGRGGPSINQKPKADEEAHLVGSASLACFSKLRRALKRYACCLGVGAGCSLLAGGIAFLIISTPSSPSRPPFLQCDDVPWDRWGVTCPDIDNERSYPGFVMPLCQNRLLGGDACVPVCEGSPDCNSVPTGYKYFRMNPITSNMNCSEGQFQYVMCSGNKVTEVQNFFEKNDISFCRFSTGKHSAGFVIPKEFTYAAVDVLNYEKEVIPNPSYMTTECSSFASFAQLVGGCEGPFPSNATDSKKRKVKSKCKRR